MRCGFSYCRMNAAGMPEPTGPERAEAEGEASPGVETVPVRNGISRRWPALLHGILLILTGLAIYLVGAAVDVLTRVLPREASTVPPWLYLTSAIMVFGGMALAAIDLFLLLPHKRDQRGPIYAPLPSDRLSVVLTAFNDESSVGLAVKDFRNHPSVRRVIVIDNNSRDRTAEEARNAGAMVFTEKRPGYGQCVYRALSEGMAVGDTDLTLLCEGDMTFRAHDIDKFLAYIPHADIVNGTRIVEQLRERKTQLTTFMYYGNFAVAKLLEAKHIGKGTFTDVGTTYKLCSNSTLRTLLPHLNPNVNLEFNAHLLDTALRCGHRLVECPVTFHARVGESKGGNSSNFEAVKVGLRMVTGLLFGWRAR